MTTTAPLTLEAFLAQPDTKPYREFVDGEVTEKAMPTGAHAIIQSLLSFAVRLYLMAHPIGQCGTEWRCVFLAEGRQVARVPDFVFIRAERLAADDDFLGPFVGAPDLVVEILSPDDRMTDVLEKVDFYLANGVRLVWLIDPRSRTALLPVAGGGFQRLHADSLLEGGAVLPGFSVPLRELLPPVRGAAPAGEA